MAGIGGSGVGRITWSQLRFRAARSLALLLGLVFAVTAFTVLTAASRTAQLRTTRAVSAHFAAAYQILVRPKGARSRLEAQTGTVQPNFLSGIYGGISLAQDRTIESTPGVAVAAPIAMVGYILEDVMVPVRLPAAAGAYRSRELYRASTTWVSSAGASRVPQPASYIYLTPRPFGSSTADTYEIMPNGADANVCGPESPRPNPFGGTAQSNAFCWSKVNGQGPGGWALGNMTARHPGFGVYWSFPMLIAAVDPVAEAKLDGFNHAVTSGRYLRANEGPGLQTLAPNTSATMVPVLAAASSGIGEYTVTRVQRLADPPRPRLLSAAFMNSESKAPGHTVSTVRTTAQQAYRLLLDSPFGTQSTTGSYWTVGPTSYRRNRDGGLTPFIVHNPYSVWREGGVRYETPPMDNADNQYRTLREHAFTGTTSQGNTIPMAFPKLVGIFDPGKIKTFDPLSRVPLGPYQPTVAAPADAASRRALGGESLAPNLNLGGYVSQPPQLITTLAALPAFENSRYFTGVNARAPISVIRVRVAGVTGPGPVSRERIREAAQQIKVRTGLDVDIVAGSSPAPTAIALPAGRFGQPPLRLTEGWVKLGVAVAILTAIDKKSVVLFALILIVCALFIANSATAAVRGRRQELGVLACLGWNKSRLFAVIFGELAWIGLAAGVTGGLLSLPLSAALHLDASPARAALAVPAAVGLALVAGTVPAWLAARADPVASVRPPVLAVRRARHPHGITGLALVNVLRTPGRTLAGALTLAVGTTALTLIIAVVVAFRGTVVGSLLGNAVAVQVRGPDYVATAATVVLGVLAVTDVLFINIRERAAELATMRALGWPDRALARLVITEGALIGLTGSATGVALGLAGAAVFAGQLPVRLLLAGLAAVAIGTAVTVAAAAVPARLLRRLPTASLLAEE
jgi:putative ABC transport system permease protein